jgi:hypothetical protein
MGDANPRQVFLSETISDDTSSVYKKNISKDFSRKARDGKAGVVLVSEKRGSVPQRNAFLDCDRGNRSNDGRGCFKELLANS